MRTVFSDVGHCAYRHVQDAAGYRQSPIGVLLYSDGNW